MDEVTTTKLSETPIANASACYPLIEFPEGVDLNDYYVNVRVGMVMAHVRASTLPF